MLTVRCTSCQKVFQTNAQSQHANVRCPSCGVTHRLATLESSTAGDSMMISPGALKQMLESPKGPGAARAHVRADPIILCPSCKVRLYVDRKKYGGRRVNCPACNKPMVIPRPSKDLDDANTTETRPAEQEERSADDDTDA